MNYRYIPVYMQGMAIGDMNYTVGNGNDMDYIKEMYPNTVNRLQEIIEQESDSQEFVGSMMYDEYPDKFGIQRIVNRIYDKVKLEESNCKEDYCITYPDDQWLKDIILILFLNEMYRRRNRRRKFY